MDSQLFYFLNFLFAATFLALFLRGRKGTQKPTPLNLKAGNSPQNNEKVTAAPAAIKTAAKPLNHGYPVKYTPRERDVTGTKKMAETNLKNNLKNDPKNDPKSDRSTQQTSPATPKRQFLPILFLYNGHDWDAYEVLGIEPGATLPQITAKYQLLIQNADPGKTEFLETAYKIILKKF